MTQEQVNEVMYATAREWYAGLGLDIDGVDLGDVMEYDVLRVMGRLIEHQRDTTPYVKSEGNGDGRTQPNS